MTKTFEEELKDRKAEIFTHMDGCTISKKVCINYADVVNLSEGWVSPEAHQARVDELIAAKEKNIELLRKNSTLKSQLQQQALPVVPSFVAEWIEILKTKGLKPLKNPETYGEDGYTVEKPQLFYLREKNTGYYLNKSKNNGLELVPNPYFDEDNQFTKQEIESMDTGSYELVPVEDGE